MSLVKKIQRWIHPSKPGPKAEKNLDTVDLWDKMVQKGGCVECDIAPACFYEGPAGGINLNIFCGNCGQGYNIAPILGWAEKIHKDEKYITNRHAVI